MLNYTYLAKKRELETLNEDNIAEYRYIALFQTGTYADHLIGVEESILRAELTRFMKKECLIVLASELADIPDDTYLKTIIGIFDEARQNLSGEAGICIGTIFSEVDEILYSNPICEKIAWENEKSGKYPFAQAANRILLKLRVRLTDTTLDQFPTPPLPPGVQPLVFPNKSQILQRQTDKNLTLRGMESVQIPGTEKTSTADRKSIMKARKGTLVHPDTIQHIAYCLEASAPDLVLSQIVINQGMVPVMRQAIVKNGDKETAKWFGPFSNFLFEQIKLSDHIPESLAKFLYYCFKKCLMDNPVKDIQPENLINYEESN